MLYIFSSFIKSWVNKDYKNRNNIRQKTLIYISIVGICLRTFDKMVSKNKHANDIKMLTVVRSLIDEVRKDNL